MARIRTVKPDFFRHEGLQDLERDNPGAYIMLTFAGLWTLCDKNGRFEWKPRTIKLDVLPFLDFDMEKTLSLLESFTYVRRYEVSGKQYGEVINFVEHQRISGKESQDPGKFPAPPKIKDLHSGSIGEATEKQLVAQEVEVEVEGKGKGKEINADASQSAPQNSVETWNAYRTAYCDRYGADPVRNAKVNSQLVQVVQRIGAQEAPEVASFYVQHNGAFYAARMHSVELLLKDCEKLRTEWVTGRKMTATKAQQMDRTQTNVDVFGELIAEARANGK